jgi:hypothetical protein
VAAWPKISAVCNRGCHSIAALLYGGIRHPDDDNVWVAASAVDLNFNFVCIHPVNRGGINFCQYRSLDCQRYYRRKRDNSQRESSEIKVPLIAAESRDLASLGRGRADGQKIERDTSGHCLKSEYLTLLNSFRMLQTVIDKAPTITTDGTLSIHPPKIIDEKELYGC